jgi:hypothetical protein
MAVAAFELIRPEPDWEGALARALERPPGVKERRRSRDEKADASAGGAPRRRIADELAWLREIVDDPESNGFVSVTAAAQLWYPQGEADCEETLERLAKLRDRGVLDAAGFLLHEDEDEDL